MNALDEDAAVAAVNLIGRTGANGVDFGYDEADGSWWASAEFIQKTVTVSGNRGPVEALEALARRLLTDATCKCGRVVALSGNDPGLCRWTRNGRAWESGCTASPIKVDGERGDVQALRAALAERHGPQAVTDLETRERGNA